MRERSTPLSGVTVVEVGAFMAAPFATMQLADLGAQVVKIENPGGGDPVRSTGPFVEGMSSPFARLNRNKSSVAINLKSDAGVQAFKRIVEDADVLVENLRPGAMQRLGLGYEDLRPANPRLVYASASGWGQDGSRSDLAGLDIMAQARGGIMSITGEPGRPPVKAGIPVCDLVCALYVALSVTAALRERERSGLGQYIDISLMEAGVSLAIWEAGKYFATGEIPGPLGSAHQSTAPYQAVQCADGWVTLGAVTPKTWVGMCRALQLMDIVDDPRFSDASKRKHHRESVISIIEGAVAHRTVQQVVGALEAEGVPCAPIADYGQVFTDKNLTDRGFYWEAEHPVMGAVRQLGSPMRFSETPTCRRSAGPVLGGQTREVLEEAGYTPDQIDEMIRLGAVAAG